MSMGDFKASLSGATPAPDLDAPLAGLWWAAKGQWDKAHKVVQDETTADSAWVHAYLHRVEGDDRLKERYDGPGAHQFVELHHRQRGFG